MSWILVALGGATGAVLRLAVGRLTQMGLTQMGLIQGDLTQGGLAAWVAPAATLTVNVLGSFCIGAFLAWSSRQQGLSSLYAAFVATGVLGGFTTFSAFSREVLEMMLAGRAALAFAYIAVSLLLPLSAVFAGYFWLR